MKFLDAKTEDLNMLAQKNPAIKKASIRLLELSADEKARQIYEARLKEQRDIRTREQGAVKDAMFAVADSLLSINLPTSDIINATGLTYDEIESRRNEV